MVFLGAMGCKADPEDTGDSTSDSQDSAEPEETGEEEDCMSYALLLADCETLALPVETAAGEYYAGIDPESATLAQDLRALIDGHSPLGFNSLWEAFELTDAREDGKVWDVYAVLPEGEEPLYLYDFIADRCGNYQGEGQCYNREHSYPSSWFGGQNPMKADLFHIRPTDGYVNNRRGNAPFAPISKSYWTSKNGSVLGKSGYCGFSGTVFEPVDAVKGDLARGLLYMSIRYRDEDTDWPGSEATAGALFEPWAEEILRAWHLMDPVDDREIARNEAVFEIQGNRNPLIDHPEWVCQIEDF
jgi:endonuclease I